MKAIIPRGFKQLKPSDQKKLKELADAQINKNCTIMLDIYLKMSCVILNEAFGFGEERLYRYLGNFRRAFRKQAKPQNPPQNASKEQPLTYEEALEFKLADGFYAGHTLRDVWKSDATYIKQLSENKNTPPRLLEAIRIINAEIRKANDRK